MILIFLKEKRHFGDHKIFGLSLYKRQDCHLCESPAVMLVHQAFEYVYISLISS